MQFFLDNFHRAFGNRIQEHLTVFLGKNAIIENYHDPIIGFSAYQPANSLPKFEDCFRQREFKKGVATVGFHLFDTRLNEGMIGHSEW